jgi:hypothetical protein
MAYKPKATIKHGLFKKRAPLLGVEVHACNPSSSEVEIRSYTTQDQPGQKKVSETPISTNKTGHSGAQHWEELPIHEDSKVAEAGERKGH